MNQDIDRLGKEQRLTKRLDEKSHDPDDIVSALHEIARQGPRGQTLWDVTVAAWAAEEIEALRLTMFLMIEAMESITYRDNDRIFVGVHGDADVTEEVLASLDRAKDAIRFFPETGRV